MSPNKRVHVKSESWLDLTESVRLAELNESGAKQLARCKEDSIPGIRRFARQMSEDITSYRASKDNYSNRPSLRQRFSLAEDISTAASDAKAQQHLLIRLRQQSYLKRSSNISTNTSLSNCSVLSTELEGQIQYSAPSVASRICLDHNRDLAHRVVDDTPNGRTRRQVLLGNLGGGSGGKENSSIYSDHVQVQQVASSHYGQVKRESSRLQAMRERLQGGAGIKLQTDHLSSQLRASTSSPLGRSWSSFSARFSDKFTSFRHSWKRFLYNYNQQHSQQPDKRDEPLSPVHTAVNLIGSDWASLDRREMTSKWVSHHHGDISRSAKEAQPTSRCQVNRVDLTSNTSPTEDELKSDSLSYQQETNSNSASIHSGLSNRMHLIEGIFTRSASSSAGQDNNSSSSITLVSDNKQALNPGVVVVELARSLDDTDQRYTPMLSSSITDKYYQRQSNDLTEARQQTSDYFSSATKSSERPQRTGKMIPNVNKVEPNALLLNDPEYYLDVAQASSQPNPANMRSHLLGVAGLQPAGSASRSMELDDDYDDYAVPSDESSRLDRSQVELVQMIGEGQKGFVFLGKLQSKDGRQIIDVAIKTLKYETEELIEKLMREAAMMRQFEHPHIIKFIGVCPETPALIAMELAQFGEIKDYLRLNRQAIAVSQLVLFTFQISTALSYLEGKQFVHRDVAARNVLVCTHSCVKLADFGLSRNLQQSTLATDERDHANYEQFCHWRQLAQSSDEPDSQYVAAAKGKLPVRWLAPESLVFRRFTSASDVWMFAVCTWEFFHFGQLRPWPNIRNNQVLLAIESGQRLAKPAACPARLYQLMLQCWSYAPIQRPKFRDLKQNLWSIYLNERAREHYLMEQHQQQQQQHQQQQQQQQLARAQAVGVCLPAMAAVGWPSSEDCALVPQEIRPAARQMCLLSTPLDHKRYTSVSPTIMTGYVPGNLSGYSSAATATAELSNDSSRSSSMGSSTRRLNVNQTSQRLGAPVALNQQKQELATDYERRVEASQKRFQRASPKGHVLQKQRSQGNIVTDGLSASQKLHLVRSQVAGLDDDVLVLNKNCFRSRPISMDTRKVQTKSSACKVSIAKNGAPDYDHYADVEDDGDSSESEPRGPTERLLLNPMPMRDNKPFSDAQYDGVSVREIAILRRNKPSSDVTGEANSPAKESSSREKKLASVLESLRVSPLRARLTSNQPSIGPSCPAESNKKQEEKKLQQLALHERLLGHIRPNSAQNSKRRSTQLSDEAAVQSCQSKKSSPSVDQSLQLLESLILGESHRVKSKTNSEISTSAEQPSRSRTKVKTDGANWACKEPDPLQSGRNSWRAFR